MFNVSILLKRVFACLPPLALVLSLAGVASTQAQTPTQELQPSTAASAAAPTLMATPPLSASAVLPPAPSPATSGNPYGLQSVWAQGDGVARSTIVLLAIMSLLSWYIIIAKLLEQRRIDGQASVAQKVLDRSEPMPQRVKALPESSPFRFVVASALVAVQRHASLAGQVDMATWLGQDIVRSVSTLQMRAQEGLSVLATVGATAPFVGLFGTVWGIYNALVTIGVSGQASIDKVAGPVGEALIMTALGLAVAVPAVLGYNWLVRRNRVTLHAVRGFGSELHTQLLADVDKAGRAKTPASQTV
jgi:biopolymer transport protein ExbB